MSAKLQHNPHIALKTIAHRLKEELDKSINYYAIDEFKNIKVSTANFGLTETIPKLINAIKKEDSDDAILPRVIVARGRNIETPNNKRLDYSHKVNVELVNEDDPNDKIYLSGIEYSYEGNIQFLLITRTSYASQEIQLELKRILNTALTRVYYSLQIIRGELEDKGILYRTDDYGFVDIDGFGNTPFEYQKDEETGVYIAYITGIIRERYFKLTEDNSIIKEYEVKAGFGDEDGFGGGKEPKPKEGYIESNPNWVIDR